MNAGAAGAILRAQWLSMRTFRLGASRRGAAVSAFTGFVWYGFWSLLAFVAAQFLAAAPEAAVSKALPLALMVVFLYWQLAPVVSASLGASLDLRKLLLYPVPHRALFLVEVLLRLASGTEMLLVLAGGAAGLLGNRVLGGVAAAPQVLLAAVAFIALNLLLGAGLRSLLERLLSRRHVREIIVMVVVLLTTLPRLLMALGVKFSAVDDLFRGGGNAAWPWTAAARLATGHAPLAGAATLAAWIAAGWFWGRWQFERTLRYDAQAALATVQTAGPESQTRTDRLFRAPSLLLPDPIAGLTEKELRSLSRTPRFRTVFVMGFSFSLLVWLPLVIGKPDSFLAENFLACVGAYSLTLLGQVSFWNSFGFDRSAAHLYFSLPVPLSRTLAGKNLAAAVFMLLEMAAVTVACLALRMKIPPVKVLEAFAVAIVAALYVLAVGNLSSVHYPRPMTPERVSQGSSGSRLQALLFLVYPVALLPVVLAYLARILMHSDTAFWLLLGFAALLGAAIYWIAMESAVETGSRRRELLLAALSSGAGPVVSE